MGEVKHLVVAKFKEGVVVQEIIDGMEKLVSEIDAVKSFEWGQDVESQEILRQGLTHAFLFTFNNREDFTSYLTHPSHVEFSATFASVIENVVLLDFPAVLVKPSKPVEEQPPVKPLEEALETPPEAAPAAA
ncbi:hypothetical protein Droror1_Dr00004119 [Drosera rotundifolia]